MREDDLPADVYSRLLALRTGLRQFEHWSENQARTAGLTPAQHQLLLAIRGHGDPNGPTIGDVARYLLLRHHSVVGLVDRADAAGLVRRSRDPGDHRIVRLRLTQEGEARLAALSALHREQLRRMAPHFSALWQDLDGESQPGGSGMAGPDGPGTGVSEGSRAAGPDGPGSAGRARGAPTLQKVTVARVYGSLPGGGPVRVLVDRLWPRGLARAAAPIDEWAKDVAPSPTLRTWYGHRPERFAEFSQRYRQELATEPAEGALAHLAGLARGPGVVLVTATRDVDHSGAAVLAAVLAESA